MNSATAPSTASAWRGSALQRTVWLAIAVAAFGGVLVALALQHFEDLDPCPLCIVQRYLHLAVAACALAAALTPSWTSRLCGLGAIAAALGGAGVASHQVWMQQNPLVARCGVQVYRLVNESLLAHWLPAVFRGVGDCLATDWYLFGLSMPAWSLVLFCTFLIAAWPLLLIPARSGH